MRILLYGRLADAIGRQVELDVPAGCLVADVRQQLAASHPAAAETLGRSRACLRSRLVRDEHQLAALDQVEFLPPVSGG